MIHLVFSLATVLFSSWLPLQESRTTPGDVRPSLVEDQQTTAKQKLQAAAQIRRQAQGRKGDERRQILLHAVEAYQAILKVYPEAIAECAEACFRIGSILRTIKETDLALQHYQKVLTYPQTPLWGARALMEIAHIYRRGKNYSQAIDCYKQVRKLYALQKSEGAQALTWEGKCYVAQKDLEAARSAWKGVVQDYREFPTRVIAAYDLLASSYLDENNEQKARECLVECEKTYLSTLSPDSKEYEIAVRAFEKMKSRKKLNMTEEEDDPEDPLSEGI